MWVTAGWVLAKLRLVFSNTLDPVAVEASAIDKFITAQFAIVGAP